MWRRQTQHEVPPYYPDHPVTRAVWAQYLNAVMAVDRKVGFVLDLLRRDGLDENTVVVFMSDHGRAMPRAKQWPYDSGLHIPLIVYWPEGNTELPEPTNYDRGSVSKRLISSIDITATTIALAGGAKPEMMQGRVFLGQSPEPAREYLFGGRDRGDETVFHIRTVRDARYRYLRNQYPSRPFLQLNRYKETSYPIIGLLRYLHARSELTGPPAALMAESRPGEELYDLASDPWEINNLSDSPDHVEVKARLAGAMDAWIEEIGDTGRIPEDKSILKGAAKRMRKNYARLNSRPEDWFFKSKALGPYVIGPATSDD